MEIRNNSNLNFNGKLNVKAMQNEIPYWKNVATLLEAETTDCPKDIFKLSEDAEGILLETSRKGSDKKYTFFWDNPLDLLKYSEDSLADKFVKFMRSFKKEGEIYEATDAYLKKVGTCMDETEFDKFAERAWENAIDVSFDTTRLVNQDELFSKAVWDE